MKTGESNKEQINRDPSIVEYETIMRSLRAGVCRVDESGVIVYTNEPAALMLGRTPEEILEKTYFEIMFGEGTTADDPRCAPFEFTLSEGENSHISTERLIRADGRECLVEMFCVPVLEKSKPKGAVMSFIDVADRRDTEAAVSRARDQALEAARSKAEFLANMSHEIRTPLTGIIGTVDLLAGTEVSQEQNEYLRMLKTSSEFLRTIVTDVLDFSKIEAGQFRTRSEIFSLSDLAATAVDPYLSIASAKGIRLSVTIEDSTKDVRLGDPRSLRQVLNNLVSNAVKFTQNGTVEVSVSNSEKAGWLRFSVKDTGIGVDKAVKQNLFAPFVQSDSSDERLFEGTGLGLAISRKLVKLLNGEIGFESEVNCGAEFWFEVPLNESEQENHAAVKKSPVLKRAAGSMRVLVVEDNPITMRVVLRMLQKFGLEAESATEGKEAVVKCRESEFDLVLMDCQMPGMDGYQAARRIKAESQKPSKIIAFTASSYDGDQEKFEAAGMDGILNKPFTESDLISVLNASHKSPETTKFLDLNSDFGEYSVSQFIERETLERLLSLESDDPKGFLSEILTVFVEHADNKLLELRRAFAERDVENIKRVVHNLRGSSANVGITGLSSLFRNIEDVIDDEDWDLVEELLHKTIGEFQAVKGAISG